MNGAGTSCESPLPAKFPVGKQGRPSRHQKTARTGRFKEMNVGVTECYILSRPTDGEGKQDTENQCTKSGRKYKV